MLKKFFSGMSILSLLVFASCSSQSDNFQIEDEGTLRYQTDILNEKTNWSQEIEKDKLVNPIPQVQDVSDSVKITPTSITASKFDYQKIYPSLQGFGLMDLSSMPEKVKKNIQSFAKKLCENGENDDLMAEGSAFELGLLLNDLNELEMEFVSYIVGMEFQTNLTCEVPVRLICKNDDFIELNVYFILQKDEWKIDGFDVLKVEKKSE